ncbi:Golgi resident protein GCP60-like [Centruroides vittatus]|uniref:Golgi resident protein GCP60-like n=1 Tax=Centruroides sculpturatus TaxID=218467 RepID=UPI000C6E402F|nr:Golgi resident protein GCP60-like [Centruroides sculpturatus]
MTNNRSAEYYDNEAENTFFENEDFETEVSPIASVSMWSRKDIQGFKELLRKEGGDGIVKVGHGETMTVRVPTRSDSSCIFWEFATDNYDIGFGLYFEWTNNPGTQVSVHISDSEDEDYDDDEFDESPADVEKGSSQVDFLPLSIIVPICRRDCHEEVHAGSHGYPGQGAYLLKFDNSYSFWRSKTVYFRVYYSR